MKYIRKQLRKIIEWAYDNTESWAWEDYEPDREPTCQERKGGIHQVQPGRPEICKLCYDWINCEICGSPNDDRYDHDTCNTKDAKSCHETEFQHFHAIDDRANEKND